MLIQKKHLPPVIPIACGAVSTFYILHTASILYKDFSIPLAFCTISAGICIIVLRYLCSGILDYSHAAIRFFASGQPVAVAAGLLIGSYASIQVKTLHEAPKTLADMQKITAITAELTGEPVPAGSDFYRVPTRLFACTDNEERRFSVEGCITILLPASLLRSSYASGITQIKTTAHANLSDWNFFLPATAQSPAYAETCRFYAKGLRLFLHGKVSKDGTAFFAHCEHPLFLGWSSWLAYIRAFFRFYFMWLLYEWNNAGGLLLALLAADKAFLPQGCIDTFRYAGLSHILALSGMHVSLMSTAAIQSAAILGNKQWARGFSFAVILFFFWFAGSAPSLNRALGMMLIAAAGTALGVEPSLLSILCTMLTSHLLVNPVDAVSLSFLLSYGACTGIILFSNIFNDIFKGKIPCCLRESIAPSAGAYFFTFPIVISSIGFIASAGIIASCIISPLISFFLIAGLIFIPIAAIFPLSQILIIPCFNAFYDTILFFSSLFARFPLIYLSSFVQTFSMAGIFCGIAAVLIMHKVRIQHRIGT